MKYYAIYNTTNKTLSKAQVKCLNSDCENIQISKDIYDNLERYIYQDGLIVENPNYEKDLEQQANAQRNAEIDSKIKELQIMALPEVLNGNIQNIKLYNEVIDGLEKARP